MLLDGGLGDRGAELFDVAGDRVRFDLVKLEMAFVAQVEETVLPRAQRRGACCGYDNSSPLFTNRNLWRSLWQPNRSHSIHRRNQNSAHLS